MRYFCLWSITIVTAFSWTETTQVTLEVSVHNLSHLEPAAALPCVYSAANDPSVSQSVFIIMEKALVEAFSGIVQLRRLIVSRSTLVSIVRQPVGFLHVAGGHQGPLHALRPLIVDAAPTHRLAKLTQYCPRIPWHGAQITQNFLRMCCWHFVDKRFSLYFQTHVPQQKRDFVFVQFWSNFLDRSRDNTNRGIFVCKAYL